MPWLFTLGLSLLLTLILSINFATPASSALEAGDRATEEVVAPANRAYVSDVLTERAREQAEQAIPEVYTPLNRDIGRAQVARAREMFDFIDVVRRDASADFEAKVASLQAIEFVEITPEVAASLLTMRDSEFVALRAEVLRILNRLMSNEIIDNGSYNAELRISRELGFGFSQEQERDILALAAPLIVPNRFLDEATTREQREAARAAIEPVTVSVSRGETVVDVGQVLRAEDIEKLQELGFLSQETNWWRFGRNGIIVLSFVTICMLYWRQFSPAHLQRRRYHLLLSIMAVLYAVLARIMLPQADMIRLMFPAAAMVMIVGVIYEIRFAAIVALAMGGIGGFTASESLEVAFFITVGSIIAVFSLRRVERINGIFRAGVIAGVGNLFAIAAFSASPTMELVDVGTLIALSLANGLLSASLTIAGFYLIGSVFGIITTLQLQELSHLDHPLLKELLRKAPGTYHHSIMVSNLAEQAAERIHANASLVRVGAFYHDVGKMTRPQFFTENQEGVNLHETLDPYSSAKVIIAHVTDGLQMARQYRLPRQVQEFIATHHGDRLIKAFYHKARDSAENPDTVDPARFSYPGPRPSSRETGLVAMADTIEAASSAIQPNNEAAVEKLVNTLIDEMMHEGQLDNTGLTLGDINAARESYIETLKGRFHVRVKYEGNEAISAENSPARVVPASDRADSAESAVDLPALPDTPPIS